MGVNSEVAGEQIHKVPLEKCCCHSVFDVKQEGSRRKAGSEQYLLQLQRVNKFGLQFAGILVMLFFSLQIGLQERR